MAKINASVFFTTVLVLASSAAALKCYRCSYPPTSNCINAPSVNELATCMEGGWCYMSKQREYGRIQVTRDCWLQEVPANVTGPCRQIPGDTREFCFCNSESCNDMASGYGENSAIAVLSGWPSCLAVLALFFS